MTNEYGVTLDRNGYAPSIVQDIEGCYYCETQCGKLDRHEVFHGASRKKSKALGLWVLLCHDCHMTLHHKDAALDALLKRQGQRVAMRLERGRVPGTLWEKLHLIRRAHMNKKTVTSQAELDAIPADYNGRIIIKFGTPSKRAVVSKKYLCPVEAHDNSSVEAYDNSSVCAKGNSSIYTYDNSSVEAYDNSSVWAHGNSSVWAHDNSSVWAKGNSQVVDAHRRGNIEVSSNARIVYNPDNITDWASANGITITDGKIRLYKAVHKRDGKYVADWDNDFIYTIGAVAEANGFTANPAEDCGQGIHMATLGWSATYGRGWGDIALLELEADADEIVVPLYETGKVRAPKALVIREVPLTEAGIMGKILAKRRTK